MIPRTRLIRKRNQMLCNLVNSILANWESEVGQGWQRGEDTRKKERSKVEKPQWARKRSAGVESVTTTTDLTMSSDVWSAQSLWRPRQGRSPAARRRGGEQEAGKEHVLPFYRGICAYTEHFHVRAVRAMHVACLDKSAVAGPCATLCAQALSCRSLWRFFRRSGRGDNGNVETKPVCSSLLHTYTPAISPITLFLQYLMYLLWEEKILSTDVILSVSEKKNPFIMYSWSTAGKNNCWSPSPGYSRTSLVVFSPSGKTKITFPLI